MVEMLSFHKEPQKHRGAHFVESALRLQCFVGLFLVGIVLLLRILVPDLYRQLRWNLQPILSASESTDELVRFAQSFAEPLFVQAQASFVPDGCSQEPYLPKQIVFFPLEEYYVSSVYGWRTHPISGEKSFHNGIDLAANEGTLLFCPMEGMVQYTGYDSLNGNYVVLRHNDGVETVFCHMQYVFVRAGEFLALGQQLGTVGKTGSATGPHLHLVLKHNGVRYDPAEMLGL